MIHFSEKFLYFNKFITTIAAVLLVLSAVIPAAAQNSGSAGAFTRLGSGARGMGMGNAMTAVSHGALQTYYNPALAALSFDRTASATFSILSFDRSLNFISFTQAIKPTGGLSFGLINAGVSNIDGRDNDGVHTDDYSTSEDQFYLSFANRMTENFTLGVSVKLYYAKLFDQVSMTTVGFDVGAHYRITPQLSAGAVLQDVSTKYTWDTKSIYDIDGRTTTDKFPQLRRIGLSYAPDTTRLITSVDFENSSLGTNILRFGIEYSFVEYFTARAGVDRLVLNGDTPGVKPTFGFSVRNRIDGFTPMLTYAFVSEPFSPQGMHILTLSATF